MAKEPRDDYLTPQEAAVRISEMVRWMEQCDDAHLEWSARMCDAHQKPPKVWMENADIARRILAWRRQGPEGPFR